MPIYDYVCANCGQLTEVIHGIDAPGPRFCPACGAEATLRKTFAMPTVHFKGSGWAKKDRSASKAGRAKPSADGADAPTSSTDDKTGKKDDGAAGSPAGEAGGASKKAGSSDSGTGAAGATSADA